MKGKIRAVLGFTALSVLNSTPVTAANVTAGLNLIFSMPQGDLRDSVEGKYGYGAGVHLSVGIHPGMALVPRLDWTLHKSLHEHGYEDTITELSLGSDLNYFLGGKTGVGFYLQGGLGYASGKFHLRHYGYLGYGDWTVEESKAAPYMQAGFGYINSKSNGLEFRYRKANYSFDGNKYAADAFQVSFLIRL